MPTILDEPLGLGDRTDMTEDKLLFKEASTDAEKDNVEKDLSQLQDDDWVLQATKHKVERRTLANELAELGEATSEEESEGNLEVEAVEIADESGEGVSVGAAEEGVTETKAKERLAEGESKLNSEWYSIEQNSQTSDARAENDPKLETSEGVEARSPSDRALELSRSKGVVKKDELENNIRLKKERLEKVEKEVEEELKQYQQFVKDYDRGGQRHSQSANVRERETTDEVTMSNQQSYEMDELAGKLLDHIDELLKILQEITMEIPVGERVKQWNEKSWKWGDIWADIQAESDNRRLRRICNITSSMMEDFKKITEEHAAQNKLREKLLTLKIELLEKSKPSGEAHDHERA